MTDEQILTRAHVRFEIAAIRGLPLTVQRYFDRKFLAGVEWSAEAIEAIRASPVERRR